MAHGDSQEGKWRGNWLMEWVAGTLTPPPNVVYQALLKLMRTPRLPAVDWTEATTDLNGLVRLGERRNLVSARVPSRSARAMTAFIGCKVRIVAYRAPKEVVILAAPVLDCVASHRVVLLHLFHSSLVQWVRNVTRTGRVKIIRKWYDSITRCFVSRMHIWAIESR